ncbi:unnamed protein product [Brachionus calyciflorus]|uniref:Uncharacterized protein n=1 Tax=Brachionus calyciflorus TaxID=104777 RepID=A0A813M9R1_9BILA|nr:unnamed protein product [Brachionus calyciflorus]
MVGVIACVVNPRLVPLAVELGANTVAAGGTAGATAAAGSVAATSGAGAGVAVGASGAAVALGPLAVALIGTDAKIDQLSWDCWKPILHVNSTEPSNGIKLSELVEDTRINNLNLQHELSGQVKMIVENVWKEKFQIDFYQLLDSDQLVGHATKI